MQLVNGMTTYSIILHPYIQKRVVEVKALP